MGRAIAGSVRGFGELEAVVMDRLWNRTGPTTVLEELRRHLEIAYTTIMSTMDNLHRKGWLSRERHGKAFTYWPTHTREEYSARLMRDALNGGGNPGLVLTHFLEQITDEEPPRCAWRCDGSPRPGRRISVAANSSPWRPIRGRCGSWRSRGPAAGWSDGGA